MFTLLFFCFACDIRSRRFVVTYCDDWLYSCQENVKTFISTSFNRWRGESSQFTGNKNKRSISSMSVKFLFLTRKIAAWIRCALCLRTYVLNNITQWFNNTTVNTVNDKRIDLLFSLMYFIRCLRHQYSFPTVQKKERNKDSEEKSTAKRMTWYISAPTNHSREKHTVKERMQEVCNLFPSSSPLLFSCSLSRQSSE